MVAVSPNDFRTISRKHFIAKFRIIEYTRLYLYVKYINFNSEICMGRNYANISKDML